MCFRAEEELVLFCVRVSMLLNMKEEENENELQTLNQQTLQTAIRLSHLSEGSAILSVCQTGLCFSLPLNTALFQFFCLYDLLTFKSLESVSLNLGRGEVDKK